MKTFAEKLTKVVNKKLGREKKVDLLAGPWGIGYDAGYAAALKEVKTHIDLLEVEFRAEERFWETK
tara:strand:+ start:253 stop:450 length:198 start_codon:yes stop_codon:yes gene_type:complete